MMFGIYNADGVTHPRSSAFIRVIRGKTLPLTCGSFLFEIQKALSEYIRSNDWKIPCVLCFPW
jgi:hypothetical protein